MLTLAESAGWQIIDSLDADTKAQLFALIDGDEIPRD